MLFNQSTCLCKTSQCFESFLFNYVWLISFNSKPLLVDVVNTPLF